MKKNDVIDIYKNIDKKIDTNIKKISVIIPNYNYEKFIEERIDSVLNQTYPIYELIILDDKSTDNSVEIIEEKIKNIKKIFTITTTITSFSFTYFFYFFSAKS